MHGEMKGKSLGAAYNRVRLINGILRYIKYTNILYIYGSLADRSADSHQTCMSYQQAMYQKYDRRGHELPRGYGP